MGIKYVDKLVNIYYSTGIEEKQDVFRKVRIKFGNIPESKGDQCCYPKGMREQDYRKLSR